MRDVLQELKNLISSTEGITLPVKIGYALKVPSIYVFFVVGDDSKYHFASQSTSHSISKPRIRIIIRHADYEKGFHEASIVKGIFASGKIDDSFGMFIDGDINYLGYEENGYPEFELTYKTLIVD